MRTLQVQFISGREVLGHYWGLLSGGGLAVPLSACTAGHDSCSFAPGQRLRLLVHVLSIKKTYALDVQVLEVRNGEPVGEAHPTTQLMVSFLPGTAPDELLDAAWADGCDAPQRRSRRLSVPMLLQVHYERLDTRPVEARSGRLVNLSAGGCCVEGPALPPPGTQVLLTLPQRGVGDSATLKVLGRVRWTERPDGGFMGVEFLGPAPDVGPLLQALQPGQGA